MKEFDLDEVGRNLSMSSQFSLDSALGTAHRLGFLEHVRGALWRAISVCLGCITSGGIEIDPW